MVAKGGKGSAHSRKAYPAGRVGHAAAHDIAHNGAEGSVPDVFNAQNVRKRIVGVFRAPRVQFRTFQVPKMSGTEPSARRACMKGQCAKGAGGSYARLTAARESQSLKRP